MARTELDYPEIAYHELVRHAAESWPERVAMVFEGHRLNFAEIDALVDKFAAYLQSVGIEKGDRVAIYLPNCPEYEIAFFGACRIGAVPSPLNPSYRAREVHYQIAEARARAVVCDDTGLSVIASVREALRDVDHVLVGDAVPAGYTRFSDVLRGPRTVPERVSLGADDLAALPFSSGTTGTSKGVMLTQRNLVCNAYQFVSCTHSSTEDRILIFLPLYHIYGVALFGSAIASGATQVLMRRFDMGEVQRLVQTERVTQFFCVPPVMQALAGSPEVQPNAFGSLRFVMSAAAPLAPDVGRRVAARLEVPTIQAYGMTEASPLTHMAPLDGSGAGIESVGVPAPDTECRIVDIETGEREAPVGEPGQVTVRGPQVMAGYWNAPDETARALRNGWLYTGDIGRVDKAGALFIVDRTKEMIKYKAFSIAPAELEAVLLEHPAVIDCAVTGHPDREAGEVPHAYVVARDPNAVTTQELQDWVLDRVASYKQIRFVDLVETIPRTPSGKILRRLLREPVLPSS